MQQDAQKQAQKFCGWKAAKKRKTHPIQPEKGKTGCFLGAGGGGSGWKRMRADGKTRSLKRNAPNNHATQAKRKPAKTQCFRRFCGRGRRTWTLCTRFWSGCGGSAPGSKRTMLLTDFSRQAQKSWCWFGAEKVADGILRNRNDIFTKHLWFYRI